MKDMPETYKDGLYDELNRKEGRLLKELSELESKKLIILQKLGECVVEREQVDNQVNKK